jgi:tRNA 2-selenouridine synthase
MSLSRINLANFLEFPASVPLIDVRSPSEYGHAHIPGAISLPLFTDEERKQIGTAYKQVSREEAIRIGLRAFGHKMVPILDAVEKLAAGKQLRVHCWRGGMRSGAVGWLLDLYGFKVHLLAGGYKAYRNHVLDVLQRPHQLRILGGCTGANKTGLLHALAKKGESVIDLENLAGHMGSAFGNLDQHTQPSQEQFENLLAAELETRQAQYPGKPVWLEAESQRIGLINIPKPFFDLMRRSPLVFLDVPFKSRLQQIVKTYGNYSREKLVNAIVRIQKKLGGLEAKTAVNALLENDVNACFAILLKYYDKLYLKSTGSPAEGRQVRMVRSSTTDPVQNLNLISDDVHPG